MDFSAWKQRLYVGCYADWLGDGRDLFGLGLWAGNEDGGGSIDKCIAFCLEKGFAYAGLEYGSVDFILICLIFYNFK